MFTINWPRRHLHGGRHTTQSMGRKACDNRHSGMTVETSSQFNNYTPCHIAPSYPQLGVFCSFLLTLHSSSGVFYICAKEVCGYARVAICGE